MWVGAAGCDTTLPLMERETTCLNKTFALKLILQREHVKTTCAVQDAFFPSDVFFCLKQLFFLHCLSFDHIHILSPVYAGYLHQQSPLMVLSYWFSSKLLAWSVCY